MIPKRIDWWIGDKMSQLPFDLEKKSTTSILHIFTNNTYKVTPRSSVKTLPANGLRPSDELGDLFVLKTEIIGG